MNDRPALDETRLIQDRRYLSVTNSWLLQKIPKKIVEAISF
jgi:hypothetical protein